MKYAVDKIEGNIVILENIENNQIINIELDELSFSVKEKDIIIFENGEYKLDNIEKINRINMLREKMNKLRGNSNTD